MKKLLLAFMMIAAFGSGFFGHTLLNVRAEAAEIPDQERYYTSIQIRKGDSLWDIAGRYAQGSGYSTQEYLDELKRMNGLKEEKIHSGEYLTVVYFAD